MMKRLLPFFVVIIVWMPACFASLADDPEIADGYLTNGEYVSMGVVENNEKLFITGGGAETIDVRDYGYLEVQDTAKPLGYHSGIYDIFLYNNSKLLYLGGVTEEVTLSYASTAELRGGIISGITLYRRPQDSDYVTIFCQEGYQKTAGGISGLWADGTAFDIHFINAGVSYPLTANYVFVEIVPEPATLLLFGLGSLLLHRKK